jgi:predicted metal-binding protein
MDASTPDSQTFEDAPAALIARIRRSGAADAALIPAAGIVVEDNLARHCREPRCENYGRSPGCPPHISGPGGFRALLQRYRRALAVRIDVPTRVLLSPERRDVMALLHDIVADAEQAAVAMGLPNARGFAGGSCKVIFCRDHAECRVLSEGGPCRNPDRARPSMSGFGINVSRLMQAAGWRGDYLDPHAPADGEGMSWIAGLVLLD